MTRRSKLWLLAAALFTIINLGGAVWAAAAREPLHAAVHVVLFLLGGYLMWRLTPWARRQDPQHAELADQRIEYLQQSVDAVALEVERLGEAQRFHEKLRAERGKIPEGDR
jgi:hypothetical protein